VADIEVGDDRLDDALRHAERAWALQRDQLPREHGDRGQALKVIGYVHSLSGDYQAALTTYELMLETLDVDTIDEEAALAQVIGWSKCRLNRCSEARGSFEDARERTSSAQVRVYAGVGLANADIADGQPVAAVERLGRLRPIIDTEFADDAELRAESSWLMARALVDAGGDRAEAREYLRRALEGYAELRVPSDIAVDLERLAEVLNVG
jgi:tetratricopeptide (TPR) repeat protein